MRLPSVVLIGLWSVSALACFGDPREFGEVLDSASGGVDDDDESGASESGTMAGLIVEGSEAVGPILDVVVPEYTDDSEVEIELKVTESSFTVDSVGQGRSDVGIISRDLTDTERDTYPDLVQTTYALDGIAVVVNVDNDISGLTLTQLADIYSGRATSWMHVGGQDEPIVVYSRPPASEIGRVFSDAVLGTTPLREDAEQLDSSGQMELAVSDDANAIAYIGAGVVGASVKTVTLDGVMPEPQNIMTGTYPITRIFYVLTGAPNDVPDEAPPFIDFLTGPRGDEVLVDNGYLPAP